METTLRASFVFGLLLCPPAMPVAGQDDAGPRARLKALEAERLFALSPAAAPTAPAKTVVVNCAKGGRISTALANNDGPLVIEVRGICPENLRIERNDLTLRGRDPARDGVQGVAADPQPSALEFYHANRISLENISVSDGPGRGIGAWYSDLTMTNCRVERNGSTGVHVSAASGLTGSGLVVSHNHGSGILSQRQALTQCLDSRLDGNTGFAGYAAWNGVLILGAQISGEKGILACCGAYVEVYCEDGASESLCGLDATDTAVSVGDRGGTANLYGVGPFSGRVMAWSGGSVGIWGGQQSLPVGVSNVLSDSARLSTGAWEGGPPTSLAETNLNLFSRAGLLDGTVLQGTLRCHSGSDAWSDTPYPAGKAIDCAHVPPTR